MIRLQIAGAGQSREEMLDRDEVTLGRAPDNDVVLADAGVSLRHARLWRHGDAIYVEDLWGTYGTRVNGNLLMNAWAEVKPGDLVGIGPFQLHALLHVGLVGQQGATAAPAPAQPRPMLIVETPDGRFTYPIEHDQVSIGRAESNDLTVRVGTVSSHHAVVRRLGDRFEIVDLNSRNGTQMDGRRIEEELLKDGTRFQLADSVTVIFRFVESSHLSTEVPVSQQPQATQLVETAAVRPEELREPVAQIAAAPPAPGEADAGASFFRPVPPLGSPNARPAVVARPDAAPGPRRGVGPLGGAGPLGGGNRQAPRPPRIVEVAQIAPAPPPIPAEPEPASILLEALNLRREVDNGKVILNNVSLVVRPQEFVAVVGVSGAGKSTLLGALSGFRPATSGQVLLNGMSLYEHFEALRAKIGYVPQDDIIHRELPVERALEYAAELRLPAELPPAAKTARVSEVLAELGLEQQRQTVVASLSGGQRKRVSIGVELLTSPPLFFLDEPTSGLDPGTETRMMALLRQLADQGRTVLLITHATRNVSMCDRVLFLARGGRVAFYGAPKVALDYFGVREFEDIYDLIENQRTPEEWEVSFAASPLYQSEIAERIEHLPGAALVAPAPKVWAVYVPGQARQPSESLRQFKILTRRYAEIVLRDRKNLAILLLQAPIIAVLLWALFTNGNLFKAPPNPVIVIDGAQGPIALDPVGVKQAELQFKRNPGLRQGAGGQSGQSNVPTFIVFTGTGCSDRGNPFNEPGCHQDQGNGNGNASEAARMAFILAATAVWLGTLNAIREISKEDAIYRRERLVNLRVFPYIASKFAVLLVLVAIQATLLFGVALIRVPVPAGGVPGVWLALVLGGAASVAVALAVSAAVSNPDRAVFAAPLIMLPQIFFAGLLVPVSKLGPAQPLAALTTARWTFEAAGRAAGIINATALPPVFLYRDGLDGSAVSRWLILLGFVVAFGVLAAALQRTKDRR